MIAKLLLPALAAIGSVSAQTATCTVSTTTINSQADATGLAGCKTVRGSVLIAPLAGAAIDISGPSQITGDLKILDNRVLESFKSNDLTIVGGAFTMLNVTRLSSLVLPSLTRVKSLNWQTINALDTASIGPPGLTEAEEVIISDTFLSSLEGIDLSSVTNMDINNNRRLVEFTTQLGNLSNRLNIQANGQDLVVSMPNLKWIANMTIANVSSISVPSLATVNGSARFDSNTFQSFSAPNLTRTQSGDISFVGNAFLTNITLPKLTQIGGGLLIANNSALQKIDGFSQLKTVGGAVKMFGVFEEAEFPALNDVKGAFNVSSVADIEESCNKFKTLAPSSQGGNGKIQGRFDCVPLNAKAIDETGDGTGSGSGSGSGAKKDAAAGLTLNTALLALGGLAGLAQALL
ncbi:hypothetical protein QBC34DRAFT_116820 [Podospora aff. communis PSN243]|uniref:Uncharacterized protein n=1 Tax=Podospora aff. communis PSN243 TaxID=3040156 RepID=A0AAV9GK76_9PEZI|nr:hypothetical protein QBC34DRAFT_116820 [Podospora aff. communis PSN243]